MVNKVILIGNLGADPEIRHTQQGKAVANFNIATSESWTDKQSGQKQEKTEWHKIVCWDRLGEICGEYLSKGSKVYIEGKITTEEWTDKDNNKRYTTKIQAREMKMLSPRSEGQGGGQQGGGQGGYQQPQQQPQQPNQGGYQQQPNQGGYQQPQQNPNPAQAGPTMGDDVPF